MMWFFKAFAGYIAPVFLTLSPILSYTDQAISMHRTRSSAGFSLDIPLIMLVASICRIFYYPGSRYDTALLVQAFFNVAVQVVVLKIALDNRPGPSSKGGERALPFAGAQDGLAGVRRPYDFWQWRSPKPYWQFLLYLFIMLTMLELSLAPIRSVYPLYSRVVGYVGLGVEAMVPLPQLLANARSRSCRGFRPSILASWLLGDGMKMFWFFTSTTEIPWSFKLCGIFQACCDVLLGLQYVAYGDGNGPMELQHRKEALWSVPDMAMRPQLPRVQSLPSGRRRSLVGGRRDILAERVDLG